MTENGTVGFVASEVVSDKQPAKQHALRTAAIAYFNLVDIYTSSVTGKEDIGRQISPHKISLQPIDITLAEKPPKKPKFLLFHLTDNSVIKIADI